MRPVDLFSKGLGEFCLEIEGFGECPLPGECTGRGETPLETEGVAPGVNPGLGMYRVSLFSALEFLTARLVPTAKAATAARSRRS